MRAVTCRGSSMPSCRSEPELHDTSKAKPASVLPPNGVVDSASHQRRPAFPHRCVGSGFGNPVRPQPYGRTDCHNPLSKHSCWGFSLLGCGRSTTIAARVRCQQLGIVDVGSGNHDAQGAARASHKQTPLDASLAPIGRVGPDPPKRALLVVPSTACQCQSTPPNASHSCIRTPQIRRKTPNATQR